MKKRPVHLVHVIAGGLSGSPVFCHTAPNLILDNEHPQLFKLLSQLLDVVADNPVIHIDIGFVPLVQRLGGQVIRISPTSTDFINPMDINR